MSFLAEDSESFNFKENFMEHRTLSIADQIFEKIETDILVGNYEIGQILTESGLSESLGVSRTPVREAIFRLEQEHLVMLIPKGIKVIGISFEDIKIIFDMRIRIEGLGARMAAINATEEQIEKMKEFVDLQEFYHMKKDTENMKSMDSNFHKILYEMTNSMHLYQTLYELHKKTLKYRGVSITRESRASLSVKEHREIYEAIAKRDADLAEKLTIKHIENARYNILNIK